MSYLYWFILPLVAALMIVWEANKRPTLGEMVFVITGKALWRFSWVTVLVYALHCVIGLFITGTADSRHVVETSSQELMKLNSLDEFRASGGDAYLIASAIGPNETYRFYVRDGNGYRSGRLELCVADDGHYPCYKKLDIAVIEETRSNAELQVITTRDIYERTVTIRGLAWLRDSLWTSVSRFSFFCGFDVDWCEEPQKIIYEFHLPKGGFRPLS
jgi:hypothetical protein